MKILVPIEISCKKKRCFDILLFQCLQDSCSAIGKFMTGENNRQLFLCSIATHNCTMIVTEASCGGDYFFGLACASIAASK
jgi:hypothetical protein